MYSGMYGTPTATSWAYPVYGPGPSNGNSNVGMLAGRDGRMSPTGFNTSQTAAPTTAPADSNNMQLQGGYLFSPAFWDRSSGQIVQIGSPQQVTGVGPNMMPTAAYRIVQPVMVNSTTGNSGMNVNQTGNQPRRDSMDFSRRPPQFFTPMPMTMGPIAGSPGHMNMYANVTGSPPPMYSNHSEVLSPSYGMGGGDHGHRGSSRHGSFSKGSSNYINQHRSSSAFLQQSSNGLYERSPPNTTVQRSRLLEDFRNNRYVLCYIAK